MLFSRPDSSRFEQFEEGDRSDYARSLKIRKDAGANLWGTFS